MRKTALLALLALAALAACSKPAPPPPAEANTAPAEANVAAAAPAPASATDTYIGRWLGVEGMSLVVARGAVPGQYLLDMQWDLDNSGKFEGVAEGNAIAFTREGQKLLLRPTGGPATGLKYLDGKADCLTVKDGEGYCRD